MALVAVFAHPDDESLFAGGLLAAAAARGVETRLLCLTRGEAGHSRFGQTGAALGALRLQELAGACAALGVACHTAWDWPDGELAQVDEGKAVQALTAWLSAQQPHVVVSFGADGAYGHRDHVRCAQLVEQAVGRCAGSVRLWQTSFEPGLFDATLQRLRRFVGSDVLLLPPEQLGADPEPRDLRLPLSPAFASRKRRAVAAHASQLPGGDPGRILTPGLLQRLCREERYRPTLGPPPSSSDPLAELL